MTILILWLLISAPVGMIIGAVIDQMGVRDDE